MRSRLVASLTVLATTLSLTAASLIGLGAPATAAPAGSSVTVYPVPSGNAGLGRITTAPDGNMWFVERTAHKIARVTPTGQIGEIAVPSANANPQLIDLDVAADSGVWVVYDSGNLMLKTDDTGKPVRPVGGGQGFADAVAGSVRVNSDGVVYNSIRYPATGQYSLARTFATGETETAFTSSPACDGPLGAGSDGAMWCRSGDAVLRIDNTVPQGQATLGSRSFLGGAGGLVPRALAAGPVGSIWFTRYADSTPAAAAYRGEIGYVDAATGAVRTFALGAGIAPTELKLGPDGAMWFTYGGVASGVGRIDAAGQGSLLTYGTAVPTSLTFSRDGALWFTDATNNTVTRVGAAALPTSAASTTVATAVVTKGGKVGKALRVRNNRTEVSLACPATTLGSCSGVVELRTAKKVRKPGKKGKQGKRDKKVLVALTRPTAFVLPPGGSATVSLKLNRSGKALSRRAPRKGLKVTIASGASTLGAARLRR